jgi:sirohydrochlorin ferrochelatase
MSLPVIVSPTATREFDAAANWLEAQAWIGARFVAQVQCVFDQIGQVPELHAVIHKTIRRARVPGFPYNIYYRVLPDRVEVIAALHGHRVLRSGNQGPERGEAPMAGRLPSHDCIAILLIAHGSREEGANDDLHQLAGRLAAQGDYSIVEPCFLELAEPDIATGGETCVKRGALRVLMVPYFLSPGIHLVRDLVNAREALRDTNPGIEFRLGPALGPDPLLDQLVSQRIRQLDAGGIAIDTIESSE